MRLLLLFIVLALFTAPAGAAAAVQVHLADGGIVSAQKVWRSKGSIFVLVNRDTLLEFAPQEVNLKKSFAKKGRQGKKRR